MAATSCAIDIPVRPPAAAPGHRGEAVRAVTTITVALPRAAGQALAAVVRWTAHCRWTEHVSGSEWICALAAVRVVMAAGGVPWCSADLMVDGEYVGADTVLEVALAQAVGGVLGSWSETAVADSPAPASATDPLVPD